VVHDGERLPFGLEASDDLLRVHAELDDLERHPAVDGLGLLGLEYDPHAPFAQ
jgi:hypothetical protein